jgi:hypothetical protein
MRPFYVVAMETPGSYFSQCHASAGPSLVSAWTDATSSSNPELARHEGSCPIRHCSVGNRWGDPTSAPFRSQIDTTVAPLIYLVLVLVVFAALGMGGWVPLSSHRWQAHSPSTITSSLP